MTGTGERRIDGKTTGCFAGPGDMVSNEKIARNIIGCGHIAGWLVAERLARGVWEVLQKPCFVLVGKAESITIVHTSRVQSSGGGNQVMAVTSKRVGTTRCYRPADVV